jgi:hypothetical protein
MEQAHQGLPSAQAHEDIDPPGDAHHGEEGLPAPIALLPVANRVADHGERFPWTLMDQRELAGRQEAREFWRYRGVSSKRRYPE